MEESLETATPVGWFPTQVAKVLFPRTPLSGKWCM